ncbi:hypothetical protein ACDI10_16485 [Vreelandella venusta]|uniref:hypothetical protein n=1 Tax=Vreelandella venusta TaxID=44935 RepID=UPI0035564F03
METAIDYRPQLSQLISIGEQIRDALQASTQALEQLNTTQETHNQTLVRLAIVHEAISQRASTEALGLYTRPIPKEDGFSKAAMLNALEQSGQLENVMNKMAEEE